MLLVAFVVSCGASGDQDGDTATTIELQPANGDGSVVGGEVDGVARLEELLDCAASATCIFARVEGRDPSDEQTVVVIDEVLAGPQEVSGSRVEDTTPFGLQPLERGQHALAFITVDLEHIVALTPLNAAGDLVASDHPYSLLAFAGAEFAERAGTIPRNCVEDSLVVDRYASVLDAVEAYLAGATPRQEWQRSVTEAAELETATERIVAQAERTQDPVTGRGVPPDDFGVLRALSNGVAEDSIVVGGTIPVLVDVADLEEPATFAFVDANHTALLGAIELDRESSSGYASGVVEIFIGQPASDTGVEVWSVAGSDLTGCLNASQVIASTLARGNRIASIDSDTAAGSRRALIDVADGTHQALDRAAYRALTE